MMKWGDIGKALNTVLAILMSDSVWFTISLVWDSCHLDTTWAQSNFKTWSIIEYSRCHMIQMTPIHYNLNKEPADSEELSMWNYIPE